MTGKGIITSILLFIFSFAAFAQNADTIQTRNPEFVTNADQMIQDLTPRLSLTDQQAREIKEILIDYQQSVSVNSAESAETPVNDESQNDVNADIQSDNQSDTSTAGEQPDSSQSSFKDQDTTGFQNDQANSGEMNSEDGVTPDVSGDPKELANRAIENVLNDTQKTTWSVIRDAWWRDTNSRYNFEKSGNIK